MGRPMSRRMNLSLGKGMVVKAERLKTEMGFEPPRKRSSPSEVEWNWGGLFVRLKGLELLFHGRVAVG